jgi:hypothetical protein
VKLPAIGFGYWQPLPPEAATRLAVLRPAHLRVDLNAETSAAAIAGASRIAPIEAALVGAGSAPPELSPGVRIARWLIFDAAHRQRIRGGGATPVVVGTNEYFTELNRARPNAAALDGSCYSINPQVHAFDNRSLVENLEAQAATVRTARSFLAEKPVHVTPVTLRPRTSVQTADPRQRTPFGAVWTLGSIKYLAEAGAASVTYYQTHGAAGLMDAGEVFPLYHVFASVAEFAGAMVHPLASSDPLETCALALDDAPRKRRRMLVANLSPEPRIVFVDAGWLGARARTAMLDETSAVFSPPALIEAAGGGTYRLALLPYSVARLDRA